MALSVILLFAPFWWRTATLERISRANISIMLSVRGRHGTGIRDWDQFGLGTWDLGALGSWQGLLTDLRFGSHVRLSLYSGWRSLGQDSRNKLCIGSKHLLIDCASSLLKSPSPFQRNNKRHSTLRLKYRDDARVHSSSTRMYAHTHTHTHKLIRTSVRMHKYADCVRVINYDISNTPLCHIIIITIHASITCFCNNLNYCRRVPARKPLSFVLELCTL